MRRSSPILWDVLEEHLEEAAFLWSSWESALDSLLVPSQVISGPEERLLAHLHALYLGGPAVAARLLEPALTGARPGAVFAAAHALLAQGEATRVLQALHAAGDEARPALVRALTLHGGRELAERLLPLAADGVAAVQAAALDVLASRRVDPGEALQAAASSDDPAVLAAALRAARSSRAPSARQLVLGALSSPIADVRDAAIETGLVLGLRDAWRACRASWVAEPTAPRSCLLVALSGDPDDLTALLGAVSERPSPAALRAAGCSGRVAAADACVAAMETDDLLLARLAGEAFSAITGLDIEGEFAAEEPPPAEEPIPFEQEDLEEDLVPSADEALPLPDPDAVSWWWSGHRTALDPSLRHLRGKPFGVEAVREAVARGAMRRRHALALELEIRTRGGVALEPRRWVRDQGAALDGLGAARLGGTFDELARES